MMTNFIDSLSFNLRPYRNLYGQPSPFMFAKLPPGYPPVQSGAVILDTGSNPVLDTGTNPIDTAN